MLLLISTNTFIVLATVTLIVWSGLVLWFTGRSKAKKTARPTPTLVSFFLPTAGKMAINVPIPMASYKRSELIPLSRNAQNETQIHISDQTQAFVPSPATPPEPALDDPAFSPAEASEKTPTTASAIVNMPNTTASESPAPAGFRLSLDRQLLSRLLSDDSLCQEFEEVRALTLDQQRDTGRPYADLYREVITHKPAEVQAMLLNLLTDEEADDFDRAIPSYK